MTATTADRAYDIQSLAPPGAVSERMDSLGLKRLHLIVICIAALGFAFDLMEVALGNVLSAVFSAPPHSVEPVQLSWLLSAMYIGAIPGALIAGWLADRYGRRIVIASVLLLLVASSFAAAASPGIEWLIAARVASGLALGAYPPLIISYLTDLMPPRWRGMLIMTVSGLAAIGPLVVVFFVRWLTPIQPLGVEAWRWAFILGSVGALLVAVAFVFLPESPRWLERRGRRADALKNLAMFEQSGTLAQPKPPVAGKANTPTETPTGDFDKKRFVILGAMYFAAPWAAVAFPLLMGAVLIDKGFALSDSLFYVGVTMFGPVIGTLAAAAFLDRIERRLALALFSIGMAISAIAFAASSEPIWIMAAGISFQILALLHVPTLTIYAAELFPTQYRARTSTAAWSLNRVASATAPLVLLPLLKTMGIWPMISVMVAALIISVLLVLMAPNGKAGQSVE